MSRVSVPGLSRSRTAVLLGFLGTAAAVAGCDDSGPAPEASEVAEVAETEGPQTWITFTGVPGAALRPTDVHVAGTVDVVTKVVSSGGGRVRVEAVEAGDAGDRAARFPSFDAAPGAPASAVLVKSGGTNDGLDPGERDFTFGADVRLDESSESDTAGSADNGNNVLQRGLYLDPAQYKLQVDHGFASCRVAGSEGALDVRSKVEIRPGVWYRLACARSGDSLTMTADELTPKGFENVDHQVSHGDTGRVRTGSRSEFLSVGAKVGRDGTIPTGSTDQFNGLVATVFVTIGGHD